MFRTERGRSKACGYDGCGTAGRTAGYVLKIPRIFSRAVERGFIGRTHGKLVHIGTTERYHALVEQVLYDGGGVGRDEVVEHFAGTGAAPAGLAEDVFVGDWHAGERGGFSGGNALIGGRGLRPGFFSSSSVM